MKNFIHKNLNFWKKGVSKSVAIIWFVSYLSIFLLPFLSGMFVHFESFNILTNQIRKMSDQIISVEQNEITRLYNMCNSTYVSICSNNTVQRLAAMDGNEELSGYTAYELKEELEDMLWNQNYIISDIWLIFNNIEYGISTSRAEPLNEFYTAESTFENGVIVYDENAYPGSLIKTSTGFAYYNIIESSSLNSSVSVYFMVDEEVMRERYKTDSFGEHGIMLFYNPDGQLIFSSTDVNDTIVEESLKILEEDKTITIGDSEYIVTTSSLYKNKYVYLIPQQSILHPLNALKKIVFTTAFISLIIGGLGIVYMIRKNIKPINDIIDVVGLKGTGKNEYDIIKNGIYMQKEERNKLSIKVNSFKQLVIDNFIHNIVLYGSIEQYVINNLEINLEHRYFVLSIIDIDDMGIFFETEDEDVIENNQRLMTVAVSNIFNDILSKFGNVYCGLLRDEIVILINTDIDDVNEIADVMAQGCELLNQHLNIISRIVVGNAVSSCDNIPFVYNQIELHIENMQMERIYGVKVYTDETMNAGNFSFENKNVFINHVLNNDCYAAACVLREVMKSQVPKGVIKYFITSMFIDAATAISRKSLNNINDMIYNDGIINLIMESPSIDSIEKILVGYIDNICELNTDEDESIVSKAYEFINSNFTNSDLNVSVLAQNMNITPAYLSFKFREKYNFNILDYLGKKRIEMASSLLIDTDMTIEAIYKKCGYLSRATFVRQFKKYTDLTPSKFKELHS